MTLPERVTDHAEQGLTFLPPWAWGKPRLAAWLVSYLREVQNLEDLLWDILDARDVRTTQSIERLKVIGKLIGQDRHGFALENYRTVLLARAIANRSDGTGPAIGRVLVALLGAGNFRFHWVGGACQFLQILGTSSPEEARMVDVVMPNARAAGVGMHVYFSPDTAIEAYDYSTAGLVLSDAQDPVTTPGKPWFDVRSV